MCDNRDIKTIVSEINCKFERVFIMRIIQIANDEEKKRIARTMLKALPAWFAIPEGREEYIRDSMGKLFFCALENEKEVGFYISSKQEKTPLNLQLWAC